MKKIIGLFLAGSLIMASMLNVFAKDIESTIDSLDIVDLVVSDDSVSIKHTGASEFVDVTVKDDGGSEENINLKAHWTTSNQDVAVAFEGRILATGKGNAVITVSYGGKEKKIKVRVKEEKDLESLVESTPLTISVSDSERDDIIDRASEMFNIRWNAEEDMAGWQNGFTFKEGETYRIPYSQTAYQCNAEDFEDALNYSDFYDTYYRTINGDTLRMPKYGSDCSGFTSFAWDISRHTTYDFLEGIKDGDFPQVGSYDADDPDYDDLMDSYEELQPGDAVVTRRSTENHVFLIARNLSDWVICYEQTPYELQFTTWDYEDMANREYRPFSKE